MKTIEFQDLDGTKISMSHSSLASDEAYRIYIEDKSVKKETDKASGMEIPQCLHLTRQQAEILVSGLEDLFSDNDRL